VSLGYKQFQSFTKSAHDDSHAMAVATALLCSKFCVLLDSEGEQTVNCSQQSNLLKCNRLSPAFAGMLLATIVRGALRLLC